MKQLIEAGAPFLLLAILLYIIYRSFREPVLLALPFLTSPLIKPWLLKSNIAFGNIDYTVLTVILIVIGVVFYLGKRDTIPLKIPLISTFGVVILIVSMSLPLLDRTISIEAQRVYYQFIGFGLSGFIAPILLVRRERDLTSLLNMFLVIIAIVTFLSFFSNVTVEGRATFLESNSIITSIYIATFVVILMGSWVVESKRSTMILLSALILFGLAGMLNTGSRGPILQLFIVAPLFIFFRSEKPGKMLVAYLFILLSMVVIVKLAENNPAMQRAITPNLEGSSMQYRFAAWSYILKYISYAPFFGNGIGSMEADSGLQAHSLMLNIFYSGGLVAYVGFLLVILEVILILRNRTPLMRNTSLDVSTFKVVMVATLFFSLSINGLGFETIRFLLFWSSTAIAAGSIMQFRNRQLEELMKKSYQTANSLG